MFFTLKLNTKLPQALLSVAVSLLLIPIAHGDESCQTLLSSGQAQVENLNEYQRAAGPSRDLPAVSYLGMTSLGQAVFRKAPGPWSSLYVPISGSYTVHSDIRFPLGAFGSELAQKLHFEIRKEKPEILPQGMKAQASSAFARMRPLVISKVYDISPDVVERSPKGVLREGAYVLVPNADLFQSLILKANQVLKQRGQEPIVYRPVRSGLLDAKQALKMSSVTEGDFILSFPYADTDPLLSPHEVAFHLSAILFPKSILERARAQNDELVHFIHHLESQAVGMGWRFQSHIRQIINQLILDRSFDLDAGLANPFGNLGNTRLMENGASYKSIAKILQRFSYSGMNESIITSLEYLVHPEIQPFDAIQLKLKHMCGTEPISQLTGKIAMHVDTKKPFRFGEKIRLSDRERLMLEHILAGYVPIARPFPSIKAVDLAADFIAGLDDRIAQISSALEIK